MGNNIFLYLYIHMSHTDLIMIRISYKYIMVIRNESLFALRNDTITSVQFWALLYSAWGKEKHTGRDALLLYKREIENRLPLRTTGCNDCNC